jgi:hypothetical protein
MKTAVEWLIEKHFGSIENCSPNFRNHIEQAKEMEKEQIMDAYWDGEANMHSQIKSGLIKITAEQYYNQTFKSE